MSNLGTLQLLTGDMEAAAANLARAAELQHELGSIVAEINTLTTLGDLQTMTGGRLGVRCRACTARSRARTGQPASGACPVGRPGLPRLASAGGWSGCGGCLAFYAVRVETFTFLFTDIEGSTALLGRVGQGVYARVLADHHAIIRSGLAAHGGREVDTQGDGFFAVFCSSAACVAAVIQMQQALQAHAWPAGEQVRVRMGVHTGQASATATGLVGLDVHRAARVAAAGHGGQVLVSEASAALGA